MLDISPNRVARENRTERLILVCIVGLNPALTDACRINLEQLCPDGYHIQECGPSDASIGCDLYIWDYDSNPVPPTAMLTAEHATKVIVLKKSSLSSVRRNFPGKNLTYLQSPVTALSLKAVLESAVVQLQLRGDEGEDTTSSRLKIDRDRILQQLLETNLKLQEHDENRTNFLTRSIHDIRVPLMAIQGYCGLFLDGQLGAMDPEQTRILEKVQRSVTRLRRLAEAMLDLGTGSRITSKLTLERANMETCVQQAVHELLPFIEKKQIRLNLEVGPSNGVLLFDAEQLERILVNLLDNACKFTPQGGLITVRGQSITAEGMDLLGLPEATGGYRIDIRDSGCGIHPDHIDQIFDEHTSYGDPTGRSGSGLGLAICRLIVQAHHGRIWAESSPQGASFSFVLPAVRSFNDSKGPHAAI